MRHACYPLVTGRFALHHADTAVRHPNTPFTHVTTVVWQVHTIHHIIFVPINILVTDTAYIVYLSNHRRTVLVLAYIPSILVNKTVYKRICYFIIDGKRCIITDSVLHAITGRTTRDTITIMLPRTALFLHVTAAITCIAQVRNTAVHQGIYLLHTPLLAVIMKVRPRHTAGCIITGYTRTQFAAHYTAAYYRTKMFVIAHPVRFHILDLVAV